MIIDTVTDLSLKAVGPILGTITPFGAGLDNLEKKREASKRILEESKPVWQYLSDQLEKNGGKDGYMVGDKVTIADLATLPVLNSFIILKASFLEDFPVLKQYKDRLDAQPGVKSYYEKNEPYEKDYPAFLE